MHKGIILASFLILVGVLVYLTYATYRFYDQEYQTTEKSLIKEHYAESIRNDKLYPGGQAIMDRYIQGNIHALEDLFRADSNGFRAYGALVLDSLFADLREKSTMDSLFSGIKKEYGLSDELEYLLTIHTIKITFQHPHQVTLFQSGAPLTPFQAIINTEHGLVVDGALKRPLPQNLVSSYTVSNSSDYSYMTTFTLFVDRQNRYLYVLRRMTPALLLGLFSIASVVSVYYITYRKWIRQKKLAEMKSDFLNSITHEFNTPLSTIIVANKNIQNDQIMANPSSVATLTGIIERQTARLEKLFGQAMDITTMDRSTLAKEPADVNLLLNEIITDYQLRASEQGAEISLILTTEPAVAELNRFFFTTMILNLLDNALKYNHNDPKTVEVAVIPGAADIQLRVTDNGLGIPEQEQEHIFDKFYRLREQGRPMSGLGLGLYYVYQCIKSHGWTLSVDSVVGAGSQFVIHIPRTP